MSRAILSAVLFLILAITHVQAHGFLAHPKPRGYNEISYAIDNLRNPTSTGNFCRGKSPDGSVSTLTLSDGGKVTFQLALSIGAEHIGTCTVELHSADRSKVITLASNVNGCASDQGFKSKSPGASSQCPGLLPSGLVTNDMCLKQFTFSLPSSLSQIDFTTGFIRWIWIAKHVSPSEYYENCADVKIVYNGKGGDTSKTTTTNNAAATTTAVNAAATTATVNAADTTTTIRAPAATTKPYLLATTTAKTTTTKTATTTKSAGTPTPTKKPIWCKTKRGKRYCRRSIDGPEELAE